MRLTSPFTVEARTIRDSEGSVIAQCIDAAAASLVVEALNSYYAATPNFARLFVDHALKVVTDDVEVAQPAVLEGRKVRRPYKAG